MKPVNHPSNTRTLQPPAGWDQKCLPEGVRDRLPPLVLSGRQLLEALNLVAPERLHEQLESEVCIAFRPAGIDMDGDRHEAGLCCWLAEYPDEGSIPLEGDSLPASQPPAEQGAGLPPMNGRWFHGNQVVCCGQFRVFNDTNPPGKQQTAILDWVCNTLNTAADRAARGGAA